jgi:polyferredoxin
MRTVLAFLFAFLIYQATYAENCNSCSGCDAFPKAASVESTTESRNGSSLNAPDTDDEFQSIEEEQANSTNNSEEEFEEFSEEEFTELDSQAEIADDATTKKANHLQVRLNWALFALFLTSLAGVFVRYRALRKTRNIFLLSTLILYGFYNGGCPCPISSFQEIFLLGFGADIPWQNLIWFLGLIPLTYLFGKTWCGWICHLGAFQEFLFKSNKLEIFKSAKSQTILKWVRIAALIALIVQLAITKTNWFCAIDPFKAAFNMLAFYDFTWYLLGLLLISSLFIYRPFCKTVCPIGLVLGWVQYIPGASVLAVKKDSCTSCKSCDKACELNAITRTDNISVIDNSECMACGDCIDSCKKNSLTFARKSKNNPAIVQCTNKEFVDLKV